MLLPRHCTHLVTALLGAALLAGCASSVPGVTQQMAAAAGQPTSLLEQGRRLYGGPCSACHTPYAPTAYSVQEWHRIVAEMSERSKLSPAQHDAVLAYVLAAREVPAAAH